METTIYALTNEFKKSEIFSDKIKKISDKMSLNFIKKNENEYLINSDKDSVLCFSFLKKEKYEELLLNDEYWGSNYGPLIIISVFLNKYLNNNKVVPFLKELLADFPDFLLFNEEVKGGNPFIYTKSHVDAFTSDLFSETLQVSPPNLNN